MLHHEKIRERKRVQNIIPLISLLLYPLIFLIFLSSPLSYYQIIMEAEKLQCCIVMLEKLNEVMRANIIIPSYFFLLLNIEPRTKLFSQQLTQVWRKLSFLKSPPLHLSYGIIMHFLMQSMIFARDHQQQQQKTEYYNNPAHNKIPN